MRFRTLSRHRALSHATDACLKVGLEEDFHLHSHRLYNVSMSEVASSSLDEVLTRHRTGISAQSFIKALDHALDAAGAPTDTPLSSAEENFLRAHVPAARDVLDRTPEAMGHDITSTASRSTTYDVASTLSIAEAALHIGVDRSRISQLIAGKRIFSFSMGRSKRIPTWQIVEHRLLPGLDIIVPAIPSGLIPYSVAAFMTTPQAELDSRTPVEFLAANGAPNDVADLLHALGQW